MFCSHCGNNLGDEAKFCAKCGNPRADVTTSTAFTDVANDANPKAFNFWRSFLKTNILVGTFLIIVFWLLGSFDEDGADALLGLLLLTLLLSTLIVVINRGTEGVFTKEGAILSEEDKKKYKGLSGWLSLVALGLIVTAGYSIFSFFETLGMQEDYQGAPFLFMYDFLTGAGSLGLVGYVIYLFFKEKMIFPRYFIYLYLYLTSVNIITLIILGSYSVSAADMQDTVTTTARTAVGGIIWGLYVIKSKRSRATFIND